MAKFRITYTESFHQTCTVEIEAATEDEALDQFSSIVQTEELKERSTLDFDETTTEIEYVRNMELDPDMDLEDSSKFIKDLSDYAESLMTEKAKEIYRRDTKHPQGKNWENGLLVMAIRVSSDDIMKGLSKLTKSFNYLCDTEDILSVLDPLIIYNFKNSQDKVLLFHPIASGQTCEKLMKTTESRKAFNLMQIGEVPELLE